MKEVELNIVSDYFAICVEISYLEAFPLFIIGLERQRAHVVSFDFGPVEKQLGRSLSVLFVLVDERLVVSFNPRSAGVAQNGWRTKLESNELSIFSPENQLAPVVSIDSSSVKA